MFSVLFEVHPRPDQWDAYLKHAKMLKPELEKIDGFVENIRYRSLTREGWILSLSDWRDEKALVRWRTHAVHHGAQKKGRSEILLDYHLRVGQLTQDSHPPTGYRLQEQRLDETETGEGAAVVMINARGLFESSEKPNLEAVARSLGLPPAVAGLVSWDVFDAVLAPGELILLMTWKGGDAAASFTTALPDQSDRRVRRVRIVRDYGMFDRRESPQYYAAVQK